ncbi:MAG: RdgB/HAM1 family non-canonical purine NTP pyrophosphatase [Chitinophagales bacterium]|nr:RdgB/HAM1 family non-canonical purine NTP pyrophosphatase [Bacteroidota bacterium]MCB9044442.1 RdgB/HAM1 family non-canonical purine NTP pyrophosphatase [Chitinophagales bacterium]
MPTELLFATSNKHKKEEIQRILGDDWKVLSLKDLPFEQVIEEPFETLEANALHKANTLFRYNGIPCIAEDTGLEVAALKGAPGVRTARYAGENCTAADNIKKLLQVLEGTENRVAQFRTVLVWKTATEELCFEGIVRGKIAEQATGEKGFGYDPVFIPENYAQTFAVLDSKIKDEISHRAIALKKFLLYLATRKTN